MTHLEAAEAAPGDAASGVTDHVRAAKALARENLEETRRLVWDLRPDLRDGAPLSAVLERQLAAWSVRSGIRGEQVVTGTARALDANRETAILQAALEALNNVKSHARAGRVIMTLSYMDDEVALDVKDDGNGLDRRTTPELGRFRLRALERGVRVLGGRVTLESQPGEGTTFSLSLPGGAGWMSGRIPAYSSSMTTRSCVPVCGACWKVSPTSRSSERRRTVARRWTRRSGSSRAWCSWICGCRRWTAWPPSGNPEAATRRPDHRAHHLRHRRRHPAGHRGRRHRLPAQGRAPRKSCSAGIRAAARGDTALAPGHRRPALEPPGRRRPLGAQLPRAARCCSGWRRVRATRR